MNSAFADVWISTNAMRYAVPCGLHGVDLARLMAENLGVIECNISHFVGVFRYCDAFGCVLDVEHEDDSLRMAKTAMFDWVRIELWLLGVYTKAALNRLRAGNYDFEVEGPVEYHGGVISRRTDLMRVQLWYWYTIEGTMRQLTTKMKLFISNGWFTEWTQIFRTAYLREVCFLWVKQFVKKKW